MRDKDGMLRAVVCSFASLFRMLFANSIVNQLAAQPNVVLAVRQFQHAEPIC